MGSILHLSYRKAKEFFLKPECYFNVKLPPYFNLEAVLSHAQEQLSNGELTKEEVQKLSKLEEVNVTIFSNKDAKYAWRPFKLIHPIIYVGLVNTITTQSNWKEIQERFKVYQKDTRIFCASIPKVAKRNKSEKSEQILSWWEEFEQAQIALYLDYEYCIHSDITDCYPSVYTHSIAWALMGKENAKAERGKGLGNKIDKIVQNMQYGQTNGIPQGSVLMDFIAEMILGYADIMLLQKIDEKYREQLEKPDFKILRYRDDYRIFANKSEVVEMLIKLLSEVLLDLNLKINSKKTFLCKDLVLDAVKSDKLYWMGESIKFYDNAKNANNPNDKIYKLSMQKHLLQIKILSKHYPNSGQLTNALVDFYKDRISILKETDEVSDMNQLISVVVSIMVNNPRVIDSCVAILGKLFTYLSNDEIQVTIDKIMRKFDSLPNTDIVEIWLQRLSILACRNKSYKSLLCKKIANPDSTKLWKSDWINLNRQKKITFDESCFIDEIAINELTLNTKITDVDDFESFDEYFR